MGTHRISEDVLTALAAGSLVLALGGCSSTGGACAAPDPKFVEKVALHGVTCNGSCKVSIAFGTTKLEEVGSVDKPLLRVEQQIASGACTTTTTTEIDRHSLVGAEIQVEPLLWSEYEPIRHFHACAQRPPPDFPAVYVTNVATTRTESGTAACPVRFPSEHGSAIVVPFETVEAARKWADHLEAMRCADALKLADPCQAAKLGANCPEVVGARQACPDLADVTQACDAANDKALNRYRAKFDSSSPAANPKTTTVPAPKQSPKQKKK